MMTEFGCRAQQPLKLVHNINSCWSIPSDREESIILPSLYTCLDVIQWLSALGQQQSDSPLVVRKHSDLQVDCLTFLGEQSKP